MMLSTMKMMVAAPTSTIGRLYQTVFTGSALGVRLYTSPFSSVSGLRLVKSETPMVTTKQMHHAIRARHMLEPSELPSEKRCRNCSPIHSKREHSVPMISPKKPPQGVVRRQNMPSRKVASKGALTTENSTC